MKAWKKTGQTDQAIAHIQILIPEGKRPHGKHQYFLHGKYFSIIPDWEPYVDDFSGELLYIDCHPFVTHNQYQNKANEEPEAFSKTQLRRSTRGKFLRLLRRRESKRFKKSQKPIEEGNKNIPNLNK